VTDIPQPQWRTISKEVRSKLGISPHFRPWTQAGKELRFVPRSSRMRDVLDVAWASSERRTPLHCDLSQCVSRKRWSHDIAPCLTGSTVMYDFAADEVWSAVCNLAVQGHPVKDLSLSNLSAAQVRDLAGEGIFLPNLAVVLCGLFLNSKAPWWGTAGDA